MQLLGAGMHVGGMLQSASLSNFSAFPGTTGNPFAAAINVGASTSGAAGGGDGNAEVDERLAELQAGSGVAGNVGTMSALGGSTAMPGQSGFSMGSDDMQQQQQQQQLLLQQHQAQLALQQEQQQQSQQQQAQQYMLLMQQRQAAAQQQQVLQNDAAAAGLGPNSAMLAQQAALQSAIGGVAALQASHHGLPAVPQSLAASPAPLLGQPPFIQDQASKPQALAAAMQASSAGMHNNPYWLPQSMLDTTQDSLLRPPAA